MITLPDAVQHASQAMAHGLPHPAAQPVGEGVAAASGVPMFTLDPLEWLGGQAQETLADGFTSMMMGLWSAAMWLLQTAFDLIDDFVPNVQDPGLGTLYAVTLWISSAIALVIAFGQIAIAVLRHDGRGFGTLAAGLVQYGLVVTCWVGVCAGLIVACSGLSQVILRTLLGVDSFSGYAAGDGFVDTVSGTVQAATLGVCALFVAIPAAFGNIVIMLVRSTALLILTATLPITAAGALSEGSKSWMWKSIRWFLACCLMDPMLALVLGIGTQFAWAGLPDGSAREASSSAENIGMSVVGSVTLLVACFMPMLLFRLLAFVDPGTASGASFRSTMSANGGVAGLLRGRGREGELGGQTGWGGQAGGAAAGSTAATATAPDGRAAGESSAEVATATRWQASRIGSLSRTLGGAVAAGVERTGQVAQVGAGLGVDVLGQSGIGNQGYYDTSPVPRRREAGLRRPGSVPSSGPRRGMPGPLRADVDHGPKGEHVGVEHHVGVGHHVGVDDGEVHA